jgi:outer membrane protein insertion porin family
MKTKPASFLRSGRFEEEKFEADLLALVSYYKKNGFIDVVIGPHEMQQLTDRHYELVIQITEGTKYIFGEVNISGNDHFSTETIQENFTMKSGDTFDQEKLTHRWQRCTPCTLTRASSIPISRMSSTRLGIC